MEPKTNMGQLLVEKNRPFYDFRAVSELVD
jgi:hypothetical protein